jgi:uncharacterized protein (TIGR02001 family)
MIERGVPVALLLLATRVAAADEPTSAEVENQPGTSLHVLAETSLATTYVFRGVPQYLEKTDPSSQTSVGLTLSDLGPGALSVGVWNATVLSDYDAQPVTKLELDATAGYTMPITKEISASLGYIGYFYPEADPVDGAHEIAAAVSWANPIVTPTLGVFAEVVRLDGVYASLGLARDIVRGAFTISPGASVAVSKYDAVDFGLNDVGARLGGKWTAASGVYAGAAANYAYNGVVGGLETGERSTVWGIGFVGYAK